MAKKKTTETLTQTESINALASTLAYETLKVLKAQSKQQFLIDYAVSTYISELIASGLYDDMRQAVEAAHNDKERYENASRSLVDYKSLLQEAVGRGVEMALSSFSGMDCQYYCQIKPVPEPTNQPC